MTQKKIPPGPYDDRVRAAKGSLREALLLSLDMLNRGLQDFAHLEGASEYFNGRDTDRVALYKVACESHTVLLLACRALEIDDGLPWWRVLQRRARKQRYAALSRASALFLQSVDRTLGYVHVPKGPHGEYPALYALVRGVARRIERDVKGLT